MAGRTHLDVYGLRIEVRGDWPEVLEAVRLDYAWFEAPARAADPEVEVLIERRPADFDAFGELSASFVTPRNTVYRAGERTIVDHLGHAVSVIDRGDNRMRIQGEDEHLVHDAVYYFLLGRIGEHLDARGTPRLHALGLVGAQGAVALLLPSGGGKSTLAVETLKSDGVSLLSEDSPLLDRNGLLHPFPLRIGVNAGEAALLPGGGERRIERLWLHPKVALEVDAFAERVSAEPQPLRHIVVGRRSLGREATLEPIRREAALLPLLRDGVVGVGLYQGLGYAHQLGAPELLAKLGTAARRARCCAVALARASVWRLTLGRDAERSWAALEPLLQ